MTFKKYLVGVETWNRTPKPPQHAPEYFGLCQINKCVKPVRDSETHTFSLIPILTPGFERSVSVKEASYMFHSDGLVDRCRSQQSTKNRYPDRPVQQIKPGMAKFTTSNPTDHARHYYMDNDKSRGSFHSSTHRAVSASWGWHQRISGPAFVLQIKAGFTRLGLGELSRLSQEEAWTSGKHSGLIAIILIPPMALMNRVPLFH